MRYLLATAIGLGLWPWTSLGPAAEPTSRPAIGRARPPSATGAVGSIRPGDGSERGKPGVAEDVDTKNLFGFTLGSDTLRSNRMEVEGEGEGRIGRRSSRYEAGEPSLRFEYGATNDLSLSAALLGDYHRVFPFGAPAGREGARAGVAEGEALSPIPGRLRFNGGDVRLRYRVLDRASSPVGLTLQVQPSRRLFADDTGVAAESYLSEHRLILDREVSKDFFIAFNLVHEVEATKARGAARFDEASNFGATFAATHRLADGLFLGGELQYLRAYEGLGLDRLLGEALYLGPTLFAKLPSDAFLTLSYNVQVAGHERGDVFVRRDLTHFERHRFLIRAGVEFCC